MKIAIVTPYGEAYARDKLFDPSMCTIGQNLLLPGIKLKEALEKDGHEYHTVDMYSNIEEIDVWVFQDLNNSSKLTVHSIMDWMKYLLKKKWKRDYLYNLSKLNNDKKSVLIMQEPQTVFPQSYDRRNHKYFNRILTWDANMIDNKKYLPFLYPQVKPDISFNVPYNEKKFVTMICGNKSSTNCNELYSERLKVIEYYENNDIPFDLYGFGWKKNERKNYRGMVEDKLSTLAKYKFSICFENMKSECGYITEKIFDCFFAGCIPIYYGADDIRKYIPDNTFIDYKKFESLNEMNRYLSNMKKNEYESIQMNIRDYINSELYNKSFSINAYVDRMVDAITRWNND